MVGGGDGLDWSLSGDLESGQGDWFLEGIEKRGGGSG